MFIPSIAWKDLFWRGHPSTSTIMKQSSRHIELNEGICNFQDEYQIKDLPICFATLDSFLSMQIFVD
jgi:hypothetical protein